MNTRLSNAERRIIQNSEIIRVEKIFECNNCSKQHSRSVRQTRFGITLIASTNGTNKPYIMTGLEGKKFCHELCAIRYVIRQELNSG